MAETETGERRRTHGEKVAAEDDLHDQPCRLGWILRGAHEEPRAVTGVEERSAKIWVRSTERRPGPARSDHGNAMQRLLPCFDFLTECTLRHAMTVDGAHRGRVGRVEVRQRYPCLSAVQLPLHFHLNSTLHSPLSLASPCPPTRNSSSLWASTQPG